MSTKIVPPTITPGFRLAVDELRRDLGPTGENYRSVRVVLAFCEAAIMAHDAQTDMTRTEARVNDYYEGIKADLANYDKVGKV